MKNRETRLISQIRFDFFQQVFSLDFFYYFLVRAVSISRRFATVKSSTAFRVWIAGEKPVKNGRRKNEAWRKKHRHSSELTGSPWESRVSLKSIKCKVLPCTKSPARLPCDKNRRSCRCDVPLNYLSFYTSLSLAPSLSLSFFISIRRKIRSLSSRFLCSSCKLVNLWALKRIKANSLKFYCLLYAENIGTFLLMVIFCEKDCRG